MLVILAVARCIIIEKKMEYRVCAFLPRPCIRRCSNYVALRSGSSRFTAPIEEVSRATAVHGAMACERARFQVFARAACERRGCGRVTRRATPPPASGGKRLGGLDVGRGAMVKGDDKTVDGTRASPAHYCITPGAREGPPARRTLPQADEDGAWPPWAQRTVRLAHVTAGRLMPTQF